MDIHPLELHPFFPGTQDRIQKSRATCFQENNVTKKSMPVLGLERVKPPPPPLAFSSGRFPLP